MIGLAKGRVSEKGALYFFVRQPHDGRLKLPAIDIAFWNMQAD